MILAMSVISSKVSYIEMNESIKTGDCKGDTFQWWSG